jgi:hypothetical protein
LWLGFISTSKKINDENTPRPVARKVIRSVKIQSSNASLVGGLNPSEKYEFVSWDYSSQYMEKQKFMFQTTNQALDEHLGAPAKVLRMRVKTTAGFQVLLWRLWGSPGSSDSW